MCVCLGCFFLFFVCARAQVRAYHRRSKAMAGRMMSTGAAAAAPAAGESTATPSQSPSPQSQSQSPPSEADAVDGDGDDDDWCPPLLPAVARQAVAPPLLGKPAAAASTATTARAGDHGDKRKGARPVVGGGGSSSSGSSFLLADDLDVAVGFDAAAVGRLAAALDAAEASPGRSPAAAALALLRPGGGAASTEPPQARASGTTPAPRFVFGDLNRPGAFVKPRRRVHKGAPGTTAPADCQCCT
jgi:hypothetical protein